MRLFLGTHQPNWVTQTGPALMVSINRLPKSKIYTAATDWFLDSGGFTELQKYGRWRSSVSEHIDRCRHAQQFGRMIHASPQDWMCEPAVIAGGRIGLLSFCGTGLSVQQHQQRTVENFCELRQAAPDVPFIPVLQGWTVEQYHECAEMYAAAGINLEKEPLVGVGSVCRRQAMQEAQQIMSSLHERGLALHGFGFKQAGIRQCSSHMASADSMAWSYNARAENRPCGNRKNCANCRHYALDWYARTISHHAKSCSETNQSGER